MVDDDHIDAAQHLIKELNPRVGGLNCIAATHHSRFAPARDANHAIQCHNIGLHWVTLSSISGKVVIYESLYRMSLLNGSWCTHTKSYVKMIVLLTSQLFCNSRKRNIRLWSLLHCQFCGISKARNKANTKNEIPLCCKYILHLF